MDLCHCFKLASKDLLGIARLDKVSQGIKGLV